MTKKSSIAKHLQKSVLAEFFADETSKGVVVDSSQWSESSQGSPCPRFKGEYHDQCYYCQYCHEKAIFTAAEQKYTYEVKKRYIWQNRVLCKTCYQALHSKKAELKAIEKQWADNKQTLQTDMVFLRRYLDLLQDIARYQNKTNWNVIEMLKKRIEGFDKPAERVKFKAHGAEKAESLQAVLQSL